MAWERLVSTRLARHSANVGVDRLLICGANRRFGMDNQKRRPAVLLSPRCEYTNTILMYALERALRFQGRRHLLRLL